MPTHKIYSRIIELVGLAALKHLKKQSDWLMQPSCFRVEVPVNRQKSELSKLAKCKAILGEHGRSA